MVSGQVVLLGDIAGHQVLEPGVAVAVAAGNAGIYRAIDCTVDTGFTGWLTLPAHIIREFGLQYRGSRPVKLADGRQRRAELYLGFIKWQGQVFPRLIHQSPSSPLLGMSLLVGSKLTIEVIAGGAVSIAKIPT